jgi:hypothetical protein
MLMIGLKNILEWLLLSSCKNDKIINDKTISLLQVVYRCANTLLLWSSLQRVESRDLFMQARYTKLGTTETDKVQNLFIQAGTRYLLSNKSLQQI